MYKINSTSGWWYLKQVEGTERDLGGDLKIYQGSLGKVLVRR